MATHLSDADLSLCVLESLLYDAEEGSGRHQRAVDVRLTDVTLDAKGISRVGETCIKQQLFLLVRIHAGIGRVGECTSNNSCSYWYEYT